MKWTDNGIILSTRSFGENSRIVTLLTHNHGRHAGLIKIPKTRQPRFNTEPGTFVEATWNARLSDHLGQWTLETTNAIGAKLLFSPLPLTLLSCACHLTDQCLADRHPYPYLYDLLKEFIERLLMMKVDSHPSIALIPYIDYELELLKNLGFGLDLSACAATGTQEDLIYISPKTGRAVSRNAGEPYKTKLLPLPAYWIHENAIPDAHTALMVTGYFLSQHLTQHQGLPLMRERLVDLASH